jgi:uncharacterized membrane protein
VCDVCVCARADVVFLLCNDFFRLFGPKAPQNHLTEIERFVHVVLSIFSVLVNIYNIL